jgi:L,D-peptidoglycan transpeptidase YkuD (ErfK/YbiS/YcfS/YnhG family)
MPFQDQVLLINETLPVRRVEENNYWCEKEEEWSVY